MATTKRSTKARGKQKEAQEAGEAAGDDILKNFYQDIVDEVDRKVKLADVSTFTRDRMSTGLACLDLAIGGGLAPGMYTFAGQEGSCKTTTVLTSLGAGLRKNVPVVEYWDYESSGGSDPNYLSNVMKTLGVKYKLDEIFGAKNSDGSWLIKPRMRYRDEAVGETFFNWLSGLERRLPDKKLIAGKWWYIFEDDKHNKARYASVIDQKMTRQSNGGLYVPAKDGALQALVLVDSWPAMNPESRDEDDSNNALAVQARMFSAHLPRIKGRLRSKRITLLGINQLRAVPMAMYGPKEQEPGGTALKFNSDARMRLTARSLSGVPYHPKGEGQFEKERSVEFEKSNDTYRYIHMRNIKNKLGLPMRETWARLWVEDGDGQPRGFDPCWDTLYYLTQTGQITGRRAALKLKIGESESKSFSITDFKTLILGNKQDSAAMYSKIGMKPVNLREGVFKQLASGKAERLYLANKQNVTKDSDED